MLRLLEKLNKYFIFFSISILMFSCGIEQVVSPDVVNSPLNLIAYPKNNAIKIEFFASNNETTFDGFDVYLSTSTDVKDQLSLQPVKNQGNGGLPTIIATGNQIKIGQPIYLTITLDQNNNPIENGITYYLVVRAHSYRGYTSQPSNETSTTPRIESSSPVTITTNNQGFLFSSQSIVSTPAGDFMVINSTNGNKYIEALNSSSIMSKGYQSDWEVINQADTSGYSTAGVPLILQPGYVFIIQTGSSGSYNYGKIQITENDANQIKFNWAYQKNVNNGDI